MEGRRHRIRLYDPRRLESQPPPLPRGRGPGNGNLCSSQITTGGGTLTCAPTSGTYSLYAYDAENRLTSRGDAAGGSDTYQYDARGALVKRTMHDGSYTIYVGGIYEENHAASGAITGVVKYYAIAGRLVAVRQAPDATGTQAGTLNYLLRDHLGSTIGLLDTGGNVVPNSKTTYWPYGAVRTGGISPTTQTDKQFTGQRIENGDLQLGLYNYNARFYSTLTGRFASADASTQDGLNRFAYVRGNPLAYNDPTGHGVTYDLSNGNSVSCPASRPDCLNDGGPAPDQSCDLQCSWEQAKLAYQYAYDASCAADLAACDAWATGANAAPVAPIPVSTQTPDQQLAAPLPEVCTNCGSASVETSSGGCGFLCKHGTDLARGAAKSACELYPGCSAALSAAPLAPYANNVVTSSCFHGVVSTTVLVVGGAVVTVVVAGALSTGIPETIAVTLIVAGGASQTGSLPSAQTVAGDAGNILDCR